MATHLQPFGKKSNPNQKSLNESFFQFFYGTEIIHEMI
jgi:hypothetical protein